MSRANVTSQSSQNFPPRDILVSQPPRYDHKAEAQLKKDMALLFGDLKNEWAPMRVGACGGGDGVV
jgi:hypothetical protein